MLETLAANILSKYLGEYLNGLSKENLKLSILSGDVSLENVELRREAVDALDLPIAVKLGTVGKVGLKIPWRALQSQPAIITLDRIFLVVGPKVSSQVKILRDGRNKSKSKNRKNYVKQSKRNRLS